MPRGPRLDVSDALYHVIARGVERRAVFRTDQDRTDFRRRIAILTPEEDITLYAFALMDNHFHLVVRRGRHRLGSFIQRLLTGYATAFNRRHERVGHLFQNRYKAILCESEEYLLELVRYVHLNPVRAGIVADPADYAWSSHPAYMRARRTAWLDTRTVLALLGGRRAYRAFIADGVGQGQRTDLSGIETAGYARLWCGGQVLGSERFARRVMRTVRRTEATASPTDPVRTLQSLAALISQQFGVSVSQLDGRARTRAVSRARRALIAEAVLARALRPADLSRFLHISTAAVARHLRASAR